MECHRAVYAIAKNLKILGFELEGHHFPEKDELIDSGPRIKSQKFIYEPTQNQKAYERRQREKYLEKSEKQRTHSNRGH